MLTRSHMWVRTGTGILVFAAWLVCSAVSRAEQPSYTTLGPNVQSAFSAFVEKPTAANLQAVRGLLVADRTYDPYSDDLVQLKKLLHEGKNREVVALVAKSQPNLLLSPQAHRLASEAAEKIGDKTLAARETVFATRCAEGIVATGDGSESRPFLVARLSDEADLLDANFKTRIDGQGLIFRDGRKYDKILGKDGNTYWFDVGLFFERESALPVKSPVAAESEGPLAQGAVARPAAALAQAHGLGARATVPPAGEDAIVQLGRDAYRAGQNDVALAALSEAMALDPHNAGIRVDRGNVRYVQREYKLAIADFSEAIRLDPGYATAYSNRGFAWNMLGEPDKAITDFNAAIRGQANFGRAYNGRGCAFQAKGMIDTAIADFDEAIRINPNFVAAYENRSSAYSKKGNKALADADAAKASQLRGAKASPASAATAEKTAGN